MTHAELRRRIEGHEGRRRKAYQDHLGYWTIGVGHLIDPELNGKLSPRVTLAMVDALRDDPIDFLINGVPDSVIDMMLAEDMEAVTHELDTRAPDWREHPAPVQEALIEMAFQLGVPRLMDFKKMWKALTAFDYETAIVEALDSKWARQTPERARAVAGKILEGV